MRSLAIKPRLRVGVLILASTLLAAPLKAQGPDEILFRIWMRAVG